MQVGPEGQYDFVLRLPMPGPFRTFAWLFQKDGTVDQLGGSMLRESGLNLVGFCCFRGA